MYTNINQTCEWYTVYGVYTSHDDGITQKQIFPEKKTSKMNSQAIQNKYAGWNRGLAYNSVMKLCKFNVGINIISEKA